MNFFFKIPQLTINVLVIKMGVVEKIIKKKFGGIEIVITFALRLSENVFKAG